LAIGTTAFRMGNPGEQRHERRRPDKANLNNSTDPPHTILTIRFGLPCQSRPALGGDQSRDRQASLTGLWHGRRAAAWTTSGVRPFRWRISARTSRRPSLSAGNRLAFLVPFCRPTSPMKRPCWGRDCLAQRRSRQRGLVRMESSDGKPLSPLLAQGRQRRLRARARPTDGIRMAWREVVAQPHDIGCPCHKRKRHAT
jgi:hypothetical protein